MHCIQAGKRLSGTGNPCHKANASLPSHLSIPNVLNKCRCRFREIPGVAVGYLAHVVIVEEMFGGLHNVQGGAVW